MIVIKIISLIGGGDNQGGNDRCSINKRVLFIRLELNNKNILQGVQLVTLICKFTWIRDIF